MEIFWTAGLLLLWLGIFSAQAQTTTNCTVGGSLQLRPPPGIPAVITRLVWWHNGDIVAEWAKGDAEVETYNNFMNRALLDTATGLLTVSNMTKVEAGVYTVEVNGDRLDVRYPVNVFKVVPTPEVWLKPDKEEGQRELVCEGVTEGAEPVTYSWKEGEDGAWAELGRRIVIMNNETTRQIQTFSCKMKNPVSEKESAPKENPFYPSPANPALGALAILPILALILIGVGVWKKKWIKERFCAAQEGNRVDSAGAGEAGNPLNTRDNGTQPANHAD